MNRVEQIEATAQRVIPVDTDTWRLAKGAALTPADAVLIAPADFHWLISNVREADRYIAASLEWMRRTREAEAILDRVRALANEARRGEGIIISPGYSEFHCVEVERLDAALAGTDE